MDTCSARPAAGERGSDCQPTGRLAVHSAVGRREHRTNFRDGHGQLAGGGSSPCSQRNSVACTRARLRKAAPCCLRHIEQWQLEGPTSGPVISKRTPLHRQLPFNVAIPAPRSHQPAGKRSLLNVLSVLRSKDAAEPSHVCDTFRSPVRANPHPAPQRERGELVAPCRVVLRTAQAFRLIGRIGGGDRTVGPRQPAFWARKAGAPDQEFVSSLR